MKKGSYWFSFLSEKEQKEFRENVQYYNDNFHELMELQFESIGYLISSSFVLASTEQGFKYWNEIYKRDVQ